MALVPHKDKQDFETSDEPQQLVRLDVIGTGVVRNDRTTIISIRPRFVDGGPPFDVVYAKTLDAKVAAVLTDWQPSHVLMLAWPGRYSQDIFLLHDDDLDRIRKALGLRLEKDLVDTQGRKWVRS